MGFVEVHPEYGNRLRQLGLTEAPDFLRLQGLILGGHPDRHLLQVTLQPPGSEEAAADCNAGPPLPAYLKKEHRVPWRDRLAHWWHGHGWVSKSIREGRLLRQLEAAGIGCPQALAFGEAEGRAFLLMGATADATDLRTSLLDQPHERVPLAQALGREVARLHAAGFHHRDLYSKHVLAERHETGWRFSFVDWQRGRRLRHVNWQQRLRDLATLDATLADGLATRRERVLCWQAYLAAQTRPPLRPRTLLHTLCRLSARLRRRRRIRELRQLPLSAGSQSLIWLDGEAICVSRRFHEIMPQQPAWLAMPASPRTGNAVECLNLAAEGGGTWKLLRRWTSRPGRWLASWWRRPLFPAPEFEQAAAIMRLERFGIEGPRLLALGHRPLGLWRRYSFLLTAMPAGAMPIYDFLRQAAPRVRRQVLHRAGRLLRRIHEAGYVWRLGAGSGWAVRPDTGAVVLTNLDGLQRRHGSPERLARKNFAQLAKNMPITITKTDRLRFYLGYHDLQRLTPQTLSFATGQRSPRKRQVA